MRADRLGQLLVGVHVQCVAADLGYQFRSSKSALTCRRGRFLVGCQQADRSQEVHRFLVLGRLITLVSSVDPGAILHVSAVYRRDPLDGGDMAPEGTIGRA